MNHAAEPIGGRILTTPYKGLVAIASVGLGVVVWRLLVGLGPTTAMSDGYPWGLWIAFEVVTGTALACGGYAVALLCYVLNKGKYHPLVRPAILTSALGYTIAGVSVVLDLGRYWIVPRLAMFWRWNFNSILLEVALCITAYMVVLWIELSPAFLEQWKNAKAGWLRRVVEFVHPKLDRALLLIVALGLLLPTMHQSSLGSLMMVAGSKLHGFWHTAWMPLFYLMTCIAMGFGVVVAESMLSARAFGRRVETPMLRSLAVVAISIQVAFLVFRFLDLAVSGKLAAFELDRNGLLLMIEVALFLAPLALLLGRTPISHARLFGAALLMLLAGGMYRFDTYLLAFNPGEAWSYFPAVPELLVSLGLIATEVAVYVALVKRFPILRGAPRTRIAVT